MVRAVTSFGRSGLSDWLLQRFTAVVLLAYVFCVGGILLFTPGIYYATWREHFDGTAMKVFSLMALLSIVVHAWIGLWQVITDYIKCAALRAAALALVSITVVSYLCVGLLVLWGV